MVSTVVQDPTDSASLMRDFHFLFEMQGRACCLKKVEPKTVTDRIMEGNRGLVYLRVMRTPSAVIYPDDYDFEFGKGRSYAEP